MENGAITNAQINASSEYDPIHAASQGRLNYKEIPGHAGSWLTRINDPYQWLQVDLMSSHVNVTGVATQGRNSRNHRQWVESYKLQYSNTVTTFQYYREPGEIEDEVKYD